MKRLAIKSVIFISLLPFVLEAGVRIFIPQQLLRLDNYFVSDEGLGRIPAPNLNTIVNTGEGEVRYITDGRGDRIASKSSSTPSLKILALGDSFLQALQVNYEDTMTALTETQLTVALGKAVKIDNTGSGNFNPPHYSILARRRLAQGKYDMVLVFLYSGNDFVEESTDYYEAQHPNQRIFRFPPRALTFDSFRRDILFPATDYLESQSHFFSLIKLQSSALMNRLGVTGRSFPAALLRESSTSKIWSVTGEILNDIKREAAKYDTPIVIVLLPTIYAVEDDKLNALVGQFGMATDDVDLQQPSRMMAGYAAQYGLNVLDLTDVFRAAYHTEHLLLFGKVDAHLTTAAHQLVANTLTPYLLAILQNGNKSSSRYF